MSYSGEEGFTIIFFSLYTDCTYIGLIRCYAAKPFLLAQRPVFTSTSNWIKSYSIWIDSVLSILDTLKNSLYQMNQIQFGQFQLTNLD